MLESPASKLVVSCGLTRLYRAIHLWQIDPVVQVITLEDLITTLITLLGCVKHSDQRRIPQNRLRVLTKFCTLKLNLMAETGGFTGDR